MFNPMHGILSQGPLNEDNTLDGAVSSIMSGWSDYIKSSHSKFLDAQKQLFKHLMTHYEDADEYAYKIITTKYEVFSKSLFGLIQDKSASMMKFLYKHVDNTDQQTKFIKAVINHEPHLGDLLYKTKGIGYRTIPILSPKDLTKFFVDFNQAWSQMEPISKDEIFEKNNFNARDLTLIAIHEKMDSGIKWCFDEDKEYSIREYMNCYNDFKKDLRSYVKETRERYNETKEYLNNVHTKNAANYKSYIQEVNRLNLEENEKQNLIQIANHNYQTLSWIINDFIMSFTIYHKHFSQLILVACKHFKDVIQLIYNDLYERKVDTEHGIIS